MDFPTQCVLNTYSHNAKCLITLHIDGYNDLKWILDMDEDETQGVLTGITYPLTDGNSVGDEMSINYNYCDAYIVAGWISIYNNPVFFGRNDNNEPIILFDGYISIEIIQ